jgi:putative transposase
LRCEHHPRDVFIVRIADRGSQYCSYDYQEILHQPGIKVSMNGKSDCYECKDGLRSRSVDPEGRLTSPNVAAETFFKIIKAELIWRL